MLDVLERAKLLLQAKEHLAVEDAEHLQGDARVSLAVDRFVDETRSPFPDPANDVEPRQRRQLGRGAS